MSVANITIYDTVLASLKRGEIRSVFQKIGSSLLDIKDVKRLFGEDGVDINVTDVEGSNALHYIASMGLDDLVETFINAGADVNLANKERGMTPLMAAVIFGHNDCVEGFLEAGAKVELKDTFGKTAMDYCVTQEAKNIFQEHLQAKEKEDVIKKKSSSQLNLRRYVKNRKTNQPKI